MRTTKVQAAKRLVQTLHSEGDTWDFITDHPNTNKAIERLANDLEMPLESFLTLLGCHDPSEG